MKKISAIFHARNREFVREKSTFIWNIAFPFLLLLVFYFVFSQAQPMFKVGVLSEQDGYVSRPLFMSLKHIQFIPYDSEAEAIERVVRHQIDLLIDIDQYRYWVNEQSRNGYMAERLLLAEDSYFSRTLVEGQSIRYVDWVLPGIIGMNIMFSSLFGVGHVIVRYRKNGVLKRLSATPLTAMEFISAHLLSRIMMVLILALVLTFVPHYLLGTLLLGDIWLLLLTLLLGVFAMVSLGLLVASRLRSEEFAGGLLNLTTWPMMGLSEVWFSLEGAPHFIQQFAQFLPLTHLVQAARLIMTEAADFATISYHLWALFSLGMLFLVLGSLLFSWHSDGR
ncbi:ABC transporter permease [Reinekea thalattae]|uniref:ABC transporter permease n=1 Tax=Reinekea thalattae TaxID=2593301 RepID=A0A5C8ZAK7_9GAMM|nr:ABC transporter permease [Reinekea thalattae]TXR54309.1 ABC transporter permease [Reinekea thalattae]